MASTPWDRRDRGHRAQNCKRPADVVGRDFAVRAIGVAGGVGPVDALLDDPVFFGPFAAYFDARIGRPSIPMETYLRLMFLKFRYGWAMSCCVGRSPIPSLGSGFAGSRWARGCRIRPR
jgi:hypothetical protein